jgi:hypothetical protein
VHQGIAAYRATGAESVWLHHLAAVARAPMGSYLSLNSLHSGGMPSRSSASRSRMVSYKYNFAGILDLNLLATFAARLLSIRGRDRGR